MPHERCRQVHRAVVGIDVFDISLDHLGELHRKHAVNTAG
jgi:hypothetical protein